MDGLLRLDLKKFNLFVLFMQVDLDVHRLVFRELSSEIVCSTRLSLLCYLALFSSDFEGLLEDLVDLTNR